MILASAAVVFLLAGFVALRDRGQQTDVVMTAAEDTLLLFPDGSEVAGAEGIELADGTRIVVGADGSATVAGVVLAPGVEAVVVDGHIEIVDNAANGDATSGAVQPEPDSDLMPSIPTTTVERSTTTGPTSSVSTTARPATSSTVVDRPTSSATSSLTRPPPTTRSSIVDEGGSSPSAPVAEPVVGLVIEPVGDARLRLIWSGVGLLDVAGWRVTATSGDRTVVVLVIRGSEAAAATLERSAEQVGYQVLAIGAEGNVLAESNVIVP